MTFFNKGFIKPTPEASEDNVMASHKTLCLLIVFFFFSPVCISTDTLNPTHTIKDGQTLISTGKIFAFGFFRPISSTNRYAGIWYNKVTEPTYVWVANRENPIGNSSGAVLTIINGNLVLIDRRDRNPLWSTNVSTVTNYSTATLMDSGNLVLKDGNGRVLWESFDHPTDSFLPGMKLGLDRRTGLNRFLTSWKAPSDPGHGEFTYRFDVRGMPQLFLMNGSVPIYRAGPWNGQRLSGARNASSIIWATFVDNEDEIYFTYGLYDTSLLSRLVLEEPGVLRRVTWSDGTRRWSSAFSVPQDQCDNYARCGPFGVCDPVRLFESECTCLPGFEPRSARDWHVGDWSRGCVRRRPLDCGRGDGFLRLARVKLPDTSRSRVEPGLSLKACEDECLKNCTCTAYANADISGAGSGCVIWDGDVIDLKVYSDGGQDFYTRVDASELDVIVASTNNFSEANMLGKGGFGPVYKGADVGFAPPAASKPAASDRPVSVADPLLAFNVAPKVGDLEAVDLKGKRVFVRADLNVLLDDKVADLNVADLKGGPISSTNRYAGIWYNKVTERTYVWVANRENPLGNSSGAVLTIINGNLELIDGRSRNPLWSTNVSTVANYSTATLMDSGNLVLKDGNGRVLWESFDHPTDSFLPGMKLGLDRRTGLNRFLTSWKAPSDPGHGEFTYRLDLRGMPQFLVMNGTDPIYRTGAWNGQRLSGAMNVNTRFSFMFVDDEEEIYLTYVPYDSSMPSRLVLDESGSLIRLVWIDNTGQWNLAKLVPKDECDNYGRCGPYGICDPAGLPESECTCLPGFEPRSDRDWHVGDWSRGCVRRRPLDCGKEDGFLRLARVKLPDTSRSRVEAGLSLKACEDECLKDCSCTAYASANISGEGKGCVMWGGDLIDLKVYSDGGQDFYTRVDASELDETSYKQSRGFFPTKKIVVSVSTIVAVVSFVSCGYYCWKRGRGRKMNTRHHTMFNEKDFEEGNKDSALSWFQSDVIVASTNNFSEANMLGKGGFGSVYKLAWISVNTVIPLKFPKLKGGNTAARLAVSGNRE
ncbi:hypothetical protein MRB53_030871 [Persea americana]|uniref:Uncharacterized protein n=1 Tax=Persea americana TaxID=3435 RepID=A0ACC2KMU0_PERAE|nr:hypothetical protein MRB53_030871 [Persea americana]